MTTCKSIISLQNCTYKFSKSNDTAKYTVKNTTIFIRKLLHRNFTRSLEKELTLTDMANTFLMLHICLEEKHFAVNVEQDLLPIQEHQRQVVFLGITSVIMLLVKEIVKLKCIRKTFWIELLLTHFSIL